MNVIHEKIVIDFPFDCTRVHSLRWMKIKQNVILLWNIHSSSSNTNSTRKWKKKIKNQIKNIHLYRNISIEKLHKTIWCAHDRTIMCIKSKLDGTFIWDGFCCLCAVLLSVLFFFPSFHRAVNVFLCFHQRWNYEVFNVLKCQFHSYTVDYVSEKRFSINMYF